jgi:hypothetical protein
MRAIMGFLIALCIFIGLPIFPILGLAVLGMRVMDACFSKYETFELSLVAAYLLSLPFLTFWLSGYCAKRFLDFWDSRIKISN